VGDLAVKNCWKYATWIREEGERQFVSKCLWAGTNHFPTSVSMTNLISHIIIGNDGCFNFSPHTLIHCQDVSSNKSRDRWRPTVSQRIFAELSDPNRCVLFIGNCFVFANHHGFFGFVTFFCCCYTVTITVVCGNDRRNANICEFWDGNFPCRY
jgi:hypothetical protein